MKYVVLVITLFVLPVTTFAETQFYYFSNGPGADSFDEHYEDVDVISPQVYLFGDDFKLQKTDDNGVIEKAQREGVKIVPLVYQQDFSQQLMSLFLGHPILQEYVLRQLVEEAEDEGYAGWQFDFENIAPSDRNGYTDFVEKAAKMFDDDGLELSVAVIPRTFAYNPSSAYQDWSAAYDYAALAKHADYLVAMAYDDGNSFGPTGSLLFQRAVLDHLTTLVPPNKLQLGIPLYCWKWRMTGGYNRFGSISHTDTEEDIDDSELLASGYLEGIESEYDAYVVPSGNLYITWCDGVNGFEAKQELAEEYNLRGTSMWAIGQEDEGVWEVL